MTKNHEAALARLERVLDEVVRADDRGYLSERYLAAKNMEILVEIGRALVEISDTLQEAHA